jgi:hypothetical protein
MKNLSSLRIFPAIYRPSYFTFCLILFGGLLLLFCPRSVCAQHVTFAGATPSVNFGNVNLCAPGKTTPAPCSKTLTLTYNVTASGTLGAIKVVTQGAPNLDFSLASSGSYVGAVTVGSTCTVNVQFAPESRGGRQGAVQILSERGDDLATTWVYGYGVGIAPQVGFLPPTTIYSSSLGNSAVAVDGIGNVYLGEFRSVFELAAGGGATRTVVTGLSDVTGMAIDGAGDLLILDSGNLSGSRRLLKMPADGGALIILATGLIDAGVGVDGAGDIFIMRDMGELSQLQVFELPAPGGAEIALPPSVRAWPSRWICIMTPARAMTRPDSTSTARCPRCQRST